MRQRAALASVRRLGKRTLTAQAKRAKQDQENKRAKTTASRVRSSLGGLSQTPPSPCRAPNAVSPDVMRDT